MRHAFSWTRASLALGTLLGTVGGTAALEGTAAAQEGYLQRPVPTPAHAFELQISGGYTQGFGNIFPNHGIVDAAGAGFGITASAGYRASRFISVEAEGQYQAYASENLGTADGLDLNIGATLHLRPSFGGDPWVRLGTGYRWVWVNQAVPGPGGFTTLVGNVGFGGFDIINARVGYDIRASSNFAWAPIVGANLQTFVWANSTPLSSVQWGTFIYAGVQARFNAGGRRENVASAGPERKDE
jgi:hypothetical protein